MADWGISEFVAHGGTFGATLGVIWFMLKRLQRTVDVLLNKITRHELEDQERLTRLETVVFPDMTPPHGMRLKRPSGGFRLPVEEPED